MTRRAPEVAGASAVREERMVVLALGRSVAGGVDAGFESESCDSCKVPDGWSAWKNEVVGVAYRSGWMDCTLYETIRRM